jgi:hypothetical protein
MRCLDRIGEWRLDQASRPAGEVSAGAGGFDGDRFDET